MKNIEYIEQNNLQESFKRYIDRKLNIVEQNLKKYPKNGMRLTKEEKMLFIDRDNYPLIIEAIKEGRELITEFKEGATEEQRKRIKKLEKKIDKEEIEHQQAREQVEYIKRLKAETDNKKKGIFNIFNKNNNPNYDEALKLEEEFIKKHKGSDLDDALNKYLYGEDYQTKPHNIDNEIFSISTEEKNKAYAILFYVNGESQDYVNKLLANNFVIEHKMYNEE